MEEDIENYKLGSTIQEFEELFGNTPFEDIEKIKKYIFNNYIPKSKVKEKIEELEKEYNEIISEYGNIDTDVIINVPNKNVRKYLDELVIKISVLQELLEDK